MSNRAELLTPIGRLVHGSLYEPKKTDAENKPLTYRTGPNAGQPRVEYFFALAIPKGSETHWNQTEWGQKIWAVGQAGFPQGQANSPAFAWKITDGDSTIPNRVGRKPCDFEGYPGHWVLKFSGGFPPSIYNADGSAQLLEQNYVNLGDYIQVYGNVSDNESQQQPGVYLNHSMIAFAGYGKRIVVGPDPKSVGFGNCPVPAGVSPTPVAQGFNPAPAQSPPSPGPVSAVPSPTAPAVLEPTVTPYPNILNVPAPAPVPPARVMLPAANGATYEQMIAAGWTDTLLIQHGMMQA